MDIKTVFLFFGIALACFAVIISVIGLRAKNFPSRGALIGLLLLAVVLVGGSTTFAVKLSIEEAHEREEGEHPTGDESTEAAGVRLITTADAS